MSNSPANYKPNGGHPAIEVNPRARFEILGAVLLGLFLGALDQTIVGPVLPRIVTDLHGADYYTWVVTAYLVTSTVSIPIYSKLSDYFGRKPLLLAGISLFLAGSALSGLSQSMGELIFFRGLQGLGAGALFPISLAVIGDLFTPTERAKYQGLFGAVFGVAFLVGPFAGGALTDSLSWHAIFFVNLPLGAISMYAIWHLLPSVKRAAAPLNLDWAGVLAITLAIVPVLIALTIAETGDWGAWGVWAGFGIGLVSLAAFLAIEWRAADPVIPLSLFRNRTFAISSIATFVTGFGLSVAIIFLPLWFQVVQGASTTASGYMIFPFLIGLIGSSILAGIFISRTGTYKWLIVAGTMVLATGLIFLTNLRADTPTTTLWIWMIVAGIGFGPLMTAFTVIVQNTVPFKVLGTATGDLVLLRQLGSSVGLTIAFTVFRNNLTFGLIHDQVVGTGVPAGAFPVSAPAGFDPGALTSVGAGANPLSAFAGAIPPQFQTQVIEGFHRAFSIALADSMWIGVIAVIIAFGASLLLQDIPLRRTHHAPEAQTPRQTEKTSPIAMA